MKDIENIRWIWWNSDFNSRVIIENIFCMIRSELKSIFHRIQQSFFLLYAYFCSFVNFPNLSHKVSPWGAPNFRTHKELTTQEKLQDRKDGLCVQQEHAMMSTAEKRCLSYT